MKRLFRTTNPTGISSQGTVLPGICAGMTAAWCRRMSYGLELSETKPGLQESRHGEYDYDERVHQNKDLAGFFQKAGLSIVDNGAGNEIYKGTYGYCADQMDRLGDGQYFWGYPGHAVGAAVRNGKYYYFNPDDGLYEFDSSDQFRRFIRLKTPAAATNDKWLLFAVEHA